jgi:hypothetical protein
VSAHRIYNVMQSGFSSFQDIPISNNTKLNAL